MSAELPRDALVIRFRPVGSEEVLRSAGKWYRYTGHYRLSVFAATPLEGESEADLRARLLKASELGGIDPAGNKKYYVCARAAELYDRGFLFCKDGDDDEVDEHYSVDLGPAPTIDDVARFLAAFGPAEKR